ncbi:hypothetical protein HNP38_002306 [Chryseobacterium defluvii]|uniref:Uncharacterized protein n=1 Tax=Chryseobacterium defluvii TaxID=160396 RepID=A0A840KHN4_9FLAO|nr:hypothetical protein [Chryseobacterium defluvii]
MENTEIVTAKSEFLKFIKYLERVINHGILKA